MKYKKFAWVVPEKATKKQQKRGFTLFLSNNVFFLNSSSNSFHLYGVLDFMQKLEKVIGFVWDTCQRTDYRLPEDKDDY